MHPLDLPFRLWDFARQRLTGSEALGIYRPHPVYFGPEGRDGRDPRLFAALDPINDGFADWLEFGALAAPAREAVQHEDGFLRFPSPRPSGDARVDRVALRLYPTPPGAPRVGVIFHHWLFLDDWRFVDMLLRPLIGRCRLAAMVSPHHLQRSREGWAPGEGIVNPNPLDLFRGIRQWHADHAACLALLARDHGFERAVVLGYSMGGYFTMFAYLHQPALPTVALCTSNSYASGVFGGNITVHLKQRAVEAGFTRESFEHATRALHVARHAGRIDASRMTWIRARDDRAEPMHTLIEAPRALKPQREVVLPGGHASAILFRRRVAREVLARVDEEAAALGR